MTYPLNWTRLRVRERGDVMQTPQASSKEHLLKSRARAHCFNTLCLCDKSLTDLVRSLGTVWLDSRLQTPLS